MKKTVRRKITILLIMSMIMQLFLGVAPVMAEDSNDLKPEPEFVPMLAVTLSSGEMAGATSATVTDYVYGNLLVNITEQEIATPRVGDAAPTSGDNMIADYESGADITAGVAAGSYLQIYDVDMEEEAQIVAFYQAELTGEDIKEEQSLTMGAEFMAEGGYTYIDENGETKNTGDKKVTKITSDTATLNEGWYIAEGIINRTDTITVNGNVHLILADSSSLTIDRIFNGSINVSENNSLTIYAQSEGDKIGALNATGGSTFVAGIGGNRGNCGNITINGGIITAKGGNCAAGIGGGYPGNGGIVTINGGIVTATGGSYGAGIGGGFKGNGGIVTIGGGIVTATGGGHSAGIGGGYIGNGGTIIVKNHPTVISTGKEYAADIGNGDNSNETTIIKRDTTGGTDLTYVRLEVQDLSPNNAYKVILHEEEHEFNNAMLTGFFVEKSTKSLNIRLEPISVLLNINPGDVQNRRITTKKNDYADPVAGLGSALRFPANSQSRIDVPLNFDTKIYSSLDFTISMWIFPNKNEPYQTLYRQYNTGQEALGVWLRYIKSDDNEGYLNFGFDVSSRWDGGWQWAWDWNNGIPPTDITKVPMNRWTHVALTKSGRSVILYANGTKYYEMILDDRHCEALAPYQGNISVGGTSVDDQFFSGRMDEIQFWNTALTLDEIKAWMYRGIDSSHNKYNNLVYYYKLNQTSGATIVDSKGSYNGTMVNMTDANWIASDVRDWTVEAGSILNGELVGSHAKGSSNDGTDWNLTFEIVEQAKKGTATIIGDNKFEYRTKDTEQEGYDSFTYRVKGSNGKYSNTETVNINITPKTIQNRPPTSDDSDRHEKPEKDDAKLPVNVTAKRAERVTTTREGDKTVTTVVIDDKKVEEELEQKGSNVVVTISDTSGADVVIGTLNGQTVKNMESKDAVLEIKTSRATYTLPASQINIDAVSEQFGKQVELKDIALSIKISEPAEDTVKIVEDTADKNNYQIVVKPIEFEISCSSGSKTVEISRFNAYVERMIAIPEGVDPSKITTGVILNSDGTFSHVPTVITMIDGKYYAKINSLTNSVYSVIYSPITFKDVENHWAQKDIYDMASRLIVSGVGNDLFEPERNITRAEFSAVMVRALGLRRSEYKNSFSDVKSGEWYGEYISTSSYYGLVGGYDDGTFKPNGNITRQEAMAILARAMDTTKLGEELEIYANGILAAFGGNADVSDWAKDSVSKCVKAGIVTGRDNGRIAPLDSITRAETAIMVRRLLLNSGLINE